MTTLKALTSSAQPLTNQYLNRLAQRVLASCRKTGQVEVELLNRREMLALRDRYLPRHINEPEILSFPQSAQFPQPETRLKFWGSVYLNKNLLKSDRAKAARLVIHGVLHLIGLDHGTESLARKMEKREFQIMKKIKAL